MQPTRAVVIRPHPAADAKQLDLRVNDIVLVSEKESSGWWGGRKEGEQRRGWFRASHVRTIQEAEKHTSQRELLAGPSRTSGNVALQSSTSTLPSAAGPSRHPGGYPANDDPSFPSAHCARILSRTGSQTPPVAGTQVQVQVLSGVAGPSSIGAQGNNSLGWGGNASSGMLQTPRCVAAPQAIAGDMWDGEHARGSESSAKRPSGTTTSARSSISSSGAGTASVGTGPLSVQAVPGSSCLQAGGILPSEDTQLGGSAPGTVGARSAGTGEPPGISRQSTGTGSGSIGGTIAPAVPTQLADNANEQPSAHVALDQATAAYLESRAAELAQILSEITDVSREPRSRHEARRSAKMQELGAALHAEREKSRDLACRLASERAECARARTETAALVSQLQAAEARVRQMGDEALEAKERFAHLLAEEEMKAEASLAVAGHAEAMEDVGGMQQEEEAEAEVVAHAEEAEAQENTNQQLLDVMKNLYEQKLEDKDLELQEEKQRAHRREQFLETKIRDLQTQLQSLREGSTGTDMVTALPQQADREEAGNSTLADMLAMIPSAPTVFSDDIGVQALTTEATVDDHSQYPGSIARQLRFSDAAADVDAATPVFAHPKGDIARQVLEGMSGSWAASPAQPTTPVEPQLAPCLGESPSVDALQMLVEPQQPQALFSEPSPEPPTPSPVSSGRQYASFIVGGVPQAPVVMEMQQLDDFQQPADEAPQSFLATAPDGLHTVADRTSPGQGLAAQAAAAYSTAFVPASPSTSLTVPAQQNSPSPSKRATATRRSNSERRAPAPVAGESPSRRLGSSQGMRLRGEARTESAGPSGRLTKSPKSAKETPPRGLVAEKVSIFEKRSQSPRSPRGNAPGALRRGPQGATIPTPLGSGGPQNTTRTWREGLPRRAGPPVAPASARSLPE